MKRKLIASVLLSFIISHMYGQQQSNDSVSFRLHKFQQHIGTESYAITKNNDTLTYHISFQFTDRGRPVPLQTTMQLTTASEPISLLIKGSTSRFSAINDSVVIQNKKAFIKVDDNIKYETVAPNTFPIAGYSPGTVQMLLLQYWKKHNRPAIVHTLPSGTVTIVKDGIDTLVFNDKPIILERYVIKGLIWGNELIWTDTKGDLYCLFTNDTEGDKTEWMREPYESLLPQLIDKAAVYGMRLFAKEAKLSTQKHNLIAITNGNVVNITNGTIINHATVILEKGKIKSVSPSGSSSLPEGAFIINAEGKTVLPGLWDMHAHFEQAEWGPAYLAAGITTVRDCGNEMDYLDPVQHAIDNGEGIGPHILKAGIIDGTGPQAIGIVHADTKSEAIQAVQQYKNNGYVQIKIYSSVKPDIVKAICEEAHRQGLPVTGHIPRGMTLQAGIDSGMDMVNHVQYLFRMMKRDTVTFAIDVNDSMSQAAFTFLKAHHVVVDPTLSVYELSGRSLKDSITDIEPLFYTLPKPLQVSFVNFGVSDSADISYYKTVMKNAKEIVKRLSEDNITIVAGTDMGMPGFSLYRELELYCDAGLTPLQAIQSATIVPARVMKMEPVSGSVEEGKNADLILVDGNPLQNIHNIRKITTVIKDGIIYAPSQLHLMAGFEK